MLKPPINALTLTGTFNQRPKPSDWDRVDTPSRQAIRLAWTPDLRIDLIPGERGARQLIIDARKWSIKPVKQSAAQAANFHDPWTRNRPCSEPAMV